jgi:hypothetical protein
MAQMVGTPYQDNFSSGNSESQQVENILAARFPQTAGTTARVITAAAAIMICVFGSFVIGDPLRVLKVFGLGLAASIVIDASLVRMVPRWVDRIVPTLGLEVDVEVRPGQEGPAPGRPRPSAPVLVT